MAFLREVWFRFAMAICALLPDINPVMKLRGWMVRPAFAACGQNLQLAHDVRIVGVARLRLGRDVFLSGGVWILANGGVTLEDEVMLGPYAVVVAGDHTRVKGSWRFGPAERAPIHLARGAWVGAHAVVTKGVAIGAGSCVAAGSVVNRDVGPNLIVGGVPARVLKELGEG